jgi:hypothetical protein
MLKQIAESSPRLKTRIAGAFYLLTFKSVNVAKWDAKASPARDWQ